MDNLDQTKNKVGESFEQHLPDEEVPAFIWDNISNELDKASAAVNGEEKTEKVKVSFEQGVEKVVLPELLWDNIADALDKNAISSNKIKTSFEKQYDEKAPEVVWDDVENQLEIETVWERVHKVLDKRTRARYWREKAIQFSLAALAILWLRGCGIGEYIPTLPSSDFAEQTIERTTKESILITNNQGEKAPTPSAYNPEEHRVGKGAVSTEEKEVTNKAVESTIELISPNYNPSEQNTPKKDKENSDPKEDDLLYAVMMASPKTASTPSTVENPKPQEVAQAETNDAIYNNEGRSNVPLVETAPSEPLMVSKNTPENQPILSVPAIVNRGEASAIEPTVSIPSVPNNIPELSNAGELQTTENSIATNSVAETVETELTEKPVYSEEIMNTLEGGPITTPEIEDFVIERVDAKKKLPVRFEVGVIGKVGTSLLVGNTTSKAFETTSMIKTEIRPSGAVGVQFNCALTRNDAIVVAAYPYASSRQYFAGYTREGRFYHREIELAHFNFSLGYQRVLFHYNDFGTVPSAVYARLEYGLGYLNKGEEVFNGERVAAEESYHKMNHSAGLAIGTTHRIKRFVLDYGLYVNMGMTSVINSNVSTMEQANLMNGGGYIGVRYML